MLQSELRKITKDERICDVGQKKMFVLPSLLPPNSQHSDEKHKHVHNDITHLSEHHHDHTNYHKVKRMLVIGLVD